MTGPENLLTEWARLVAWSIAASGVRDVIVSPGSRSTPFVLAMAGRSDLSITSVIDERSAAFVALGMARASGRPAAVLATSGSAPAHWFPAVIEASTANLPMVLLSADRPLALAQAGAAQTIDQTKLFGDWVRFFADLGDPRDDVASFEGVSRTISQAVASANGRPAGPVHLNLRADRPLEPIERLNALHARVDACIARGVTKFSSAPEGLDEAFAEELAQALLRSERPLVILGPRAPWGRDVSPALSVLGVSCAAEASSQLRFGPRGPHVIDAFEHLFSCRSFAAENAPDLILQVGSLPTPSTYLEVARGVPRFVLDAGGFRDPVGGAVAVSTAAAGPTLDRVASLVGERARRPYAADLARADALAWSEVERALAGPFGEGAVLRAAMTVLPDEAIVCIGNSLPIRTLDRFVRGSPRKHAVLAQRGVNGIDGLVAGAVGAGLATRKPVLAIIGDVSLLHDAGSLLSLRAMKTPLVLVVVDNGGGRIFEELPIAKRHALEDHMHLFTTPHAVDLGALAVAYGVELAEVRTGAEVSRAVSTGIARSAGTLVRAIVAPHEASESLAALRRAIAEVLA